MNIDSKLIELGVTENVLETFHSKTNNSHLKIEKASLAYSGHVYNGVNDDGSIIINLSISDSFKVTQLVQYTINLAKIRQKKINIILGSSKNL